MTFFVLAPPRSMTAWLANLLTSERSVCYHDVLTNGGLARMRLLATPDTGFAETAGLAVPRTLLGMFPSARVAVIRSDPMRVAGSLNRLGVDGDGFVQYAAPQVARAMDLLKDRALFVHDFEVLDRASEISMHLIGREPSPARLELLRSLQITKLKPLLGDARELKELIRRER